MYCASCKRYDETDIDPLDNIEKFMKFIKAEQEKINPTKNALKDPKPKLRHPDMADDSISEITDLEKDQILNKYYGEVKCRLA